MDGCLITFLDKHGFLIHEMPGAVAFGVVLQGKFLLVAVLLVDERRLIDVRLCVLGDLHEGRDMIADLIRTEIHRWQVVITVAHDADERT